MASAATPSTMSAAAAAHAMPGAAAAAAEATNKPAAATSNGGGNDIYAQLAQKETDLILAAELGKALLEKNEELGRQNEAMSEEFALKIGVRKG